ncbi:ELM1/GtrOC1 family putative glycosyltransferase [Ciceribacter sp. L1K22]|uniref:ELM1/GtrOC1 family putative glycosyltransferase n=1 Tax=Ciceribacter sp. L1K22 TaxID=2820275 RepID=UPI001ABE1DA2|nr:ELM1/GtrOC1 family putative glycosyltransferase [Ciceribacter sp. L1K22]MBO3762479.1 mitochondrial fission ELM1 family protein [Ciceribacter sp. L1K22]
MRIWIVETGLQGVTNQCMGLARAIATRIPSEIVIVRKTIRSKRIRPLINWALNHGFIGSSRNDLLSRILEYLLYRGTTLRLEKPDVVITALARSEYTAALFGGQQGAFTIHIGWPLNLPASRFDFLALIAEENVDTGCTPHVKLPIYPTPVLRRDIDSMSTKNLADQKRRWAVLIGGDGAGYRYTKTDWDQIASGLTQLATRLDARLLVTTSRRTGNDTERRLSSAFPASVFEQAVWYGSNPEAVISTYLAKCELVFCTADSRSMVADAIAAGRPVYAIDHPDAAKDAIHQKFLAIHEQTQRLRAIDVGRLGQIDVDADLLHHFKPLPSCWSEEFLEALFKTDFPRRFLTDSTSYRVDQRH